MIQTQQESIDAVKQMLSQLLKDKKKPKAKTPSKKSIGKQKEGESSSSVNTENDEHSNSEPPKSSSEEEDNSENRSIHAKRMSKLEQCLEALINQDGLQDVGIVQPYPVEWDIAPTLSNSRHRPFILSTVKGHRTNTYTTSNPKMGM